MTNGTDIKPKDNSALGFLFIVALALFLRLTFVFLTDNFSGVLPAQRIVYAQQLQFKAADYGILDPFIPPLYPYVLRAWLGICHDIISAPRLLAVLLGMLTLVPFFLIVKLVKGKDSALLAMLLLAVSPLHIIYSTLSLEDMPFYCVIFYALYFFLRYQCESKAMRYLALSAVLTSCSFGFRFEGLLYAILLSAILVAGKNKKPFFLFASVSFLLPLAWMLVCIFKFGDPLFSYTWHAYYSRLNQLGGCRLECVIEKITRVFSLPLLLFGGVGFLISLKDVRMRVLNIIFVSFVTAFSIKIAGGTLSWDPKYFLTFGLFLVIYEAVGLLYFFDDFKSQHTQALFISILCIYAVLFGVKYITNQDTIAQSFSLPLEIKNIPALLGDTAADKQILIDTDYMNWYPEHIIVGTGLAAHRFKIADEIEVFGHRVKKGQGLAKCKSHLLNLMGNGRFAYIVYAPEGRSLRFIDPLFLQEEHIGKVTYRRIFSGRIYWVYKLEESE
ncbi:MAG TPA: glycosyltransferase family 39 protein [Patescibacteria group bacterium]|nr:glycosyltransferase family 39 protein [Patescibacteria group bacterium]